MTQNAPQTLVCLLCGKPITYTQQFRIATAGKVGFLHTACVQKLPKAA